MAFTRVTKDAGVISALHDKPNIEDGLTPDDLKAKFDELGAALKSYLNDTLCAELEASTGAANIGFSSSAGITASTIAAALDELKAAIVGATVGTLPAGSVGPTTLADGAVTTAKLGALAVTEGKIYDGSVTAGKIGASAVETAKINDGAVTTAKLAAAAVTAEKLGAKAVKTTNLADDLVVPVVNGGTGSTSAADARTALGAQAVIQAASFSLDDASWTTSGTKKVQAVTISGLAATSKFVASPADPTSWDLAADAGLKTPEIVTIDDAIKLQFTADAAPADDISVTVYWW